MTLNRILLPTDLSESADHAMRQAVEMAAQHQGMLDVFHVVTIDREDPTHLEQALGEYLEKVEKEVFEDLSTRTEAIRTRGIKVEISTARSLSPQDAILDRIEDTKPDLVVMGTHGRSGVKKLFLGSVAESIVRRSPVDVMTVGREAKVAESEAGFDPILVPVDFTDYSERAIARAKNLLAENGRIVLEHVVSSPIHPSFYAGGMTRMFQVDPELPQRIREKLKSLYDGPGELVVSEGDVVEDILETATSRKVQLIVMGTRGLSGLDHVLMGSVTERVIRSAPVPVLSVK
jgi:nucleotide-binding universal stress UspA family protein